ncbi:MAG: hypothetical protein ABR956_14805 [Terracidiphilus sp.]|jgi:hypothetical protein
MKHFLNGILCLLILAPIAGAQAPGAASQPPPTKVDPKAAAPVKQAEAATVGLPTPANDLRTGKYAYQVTVEVNGQTFDLKVNTVITDGGSSWTATNTMETPQGTGTDTTTIDKGSLILRKRSVLQGPLLIDLDFAGDKATGKIDMNGEVHQVASDLGGPLFGDGAGGDQVLACLPLAVGYSTTFRNFDVEAQKVKLMQLSVPSVEAVTVPAGKFEAYRVEIAPSDGGDKKTLWIAKDSHKVVKGSAVVASMGGAALTQELTE